MSAAVHGYMRKTMNISLSEEMHSFILERVRAEYHSSASEYIRSLIRRERSNLGAEQSPAVLPPPRTANEVLAGLERGMISFDEQP